MSLEPPSSVELKKVSDVVGLGLFAKQAYKVGETVFTDRPFTHIQHSSNQSALRHCSTCGKRVGGVFEQTTMLLSGMGDNSLINQTADVLAGLGEQTQTSIVQCICGLAYCSFDCRIKGWEAHHWALCVAHEADEYGREGPVMKYKEFCLGIPGCGDTLLLAANTFSSMVASCRDEVELKGLVDSVLALKHEPFAEVALPSGEDPDDFKSWVEGLVEEGFELLEAALSPCKHPLFKSLFSLGGKELYERLLGIFEWNNIDIKISSSWVSEEYLRILGSASEAEKAQLRKLFLEKEVTLRALKELGVDIDGTAFNDEEEEEEEEEDQESDNEGTKEPSASSSASKEMEGESSSSSPPCDCCPSSSSCAQSPEQEAHQCEEAEQVGDIVQEIKDEARKKAQEDPSCFDPPYPSEEGKEVGWWPAFRGTGLYPSVARLNHSCSPNISIEFKKNTVECEAQVRREVEEGEELTISYVNEDLPVETRRAKLQSFYSFWCVCPKCLKEEKSAEN